MNLSDEMKRSWQLLCVCLTLRASFAFCLFFLTVSSLFLPISSLSLSQLHSSISISFLSSVSVSFSNNLNSITKSFYWHASLKTNLADKSETLLLSVSLPPPPSPPYPPKAQVPSDVGFWDSFWTSDEEVRLGHFHTDVGFARRATL